MSLFPAYSAGGASSSGSSSSQQISHDDDRQLVVTSALDWLKNESFQQQTSKNPIIEIISSESESESSSVEIVSTTTTTTTTPSDDEAGVIAKKLRLDEQTASSTTKEPLETKAPLGANFLEDLSISALNRPTAYRIDRSQNRSLAKFCSIFDGHLSKYWSVSPLLALKSANETVVFRKKEAILASLEKNSKKKKQQQQQQREKRYFDASQLKRLRKVQDLGGEPLRKSPIPVTALPQVLKLKPTSLAEFPTTTTKLGIDGNKAELPYDELKKASVRQKTEELNKRLNLEPKNVPLWLEFIDFQNDVARFGDSQMTEAALIEKKLAVLDRALAWNPGNVQLLVEKIKLKGSQTANQDAIAEEWRNIAFVHPNNAEVWWECLMAHCRRFAAFNVDKLQTTFAKCLSTMSNILDGTIKSHRPGHDMEEQMIYIFVSLVYIMREAGFTERAVVLLQCQIEFALFAPQHIAQLPRTSAVDELELYFSANLPLFGLEGARGWNTWKPNQKTDITTEQSKQRDLALMEEDEIDRLVVERAPERSSKSEIWSFLEEARSARRVLPLPPDAPPTDDPERQVVFDDISRFLVRINRPENRYRLLLAFFEFFGVDVSSCGGSTLDTFLKRDSFSSSFSCRNAVGAIFRDATITTRPKLIHYAQSVCQETVSRAFNQAIGMLQEPFRTHLICTYVKHEMASCQLLCEEKRAKQVKTLIREILREPANRNNLAVWALCSECEYRLEHNVKEAVRIAETAISIAHQMKLYASWGALCHLASQTSLLALRFDCIDLHERQRPFDISRIIVEEANVNDPATVRPLVQLLASCLLRRTVPKDELNDLLQLKATVSEQIGPSIAIADLPDDNEEEQQLMPVPPLICQLAECFTLFSYLTDRISRSRFVVPLTQADSVFTTLLNRVDQLSKTNKVISASPFATIRRFLEQVSLCLHSSRIVMAAFDYRSSVKSVSHLKEIVLCALADFPSNDAFLRCLIAIREPAFLSSSFVKLTRSMSHRISHPLAWLAILQAMMAKMESISGAENLVRSLFEKAVSASKPTCNRSASLWAFYVAFEATTINITTTSRQPSKRIETVLFRALQSCPWAKEIYLALARNQQGDVKKLNDVVDMIVEKGLRLHTLVDELSPFSITTS